MNFDNGFDYVGLLLYVGGIALVIMHFAMAGKKDDDLAMAASEEGESTE